ncbi:amphoterin-induced protein 1 [Callorhinchus milii]|uniref:Adhesion molecule with Ig like domain 1 n=1 Tax=Callorhinchus milii TaxID=7868 RepID=A0A4W3IQZ5_CALMI|nr:amphoterin-induced protein 1 [Callorhinchus milii]|eukprot:gi/632962942/ref/XP_007897606.1/ PREDICTED: amphoterin-induced protein 1 [Callorhinchus milii]
MWKSSALGFRLTILALFGCWANVAALTCHPDCICASNIVSCSKKELVAIPNSIPEYTAILDLSYNSLSRLRAEWTSVHLNKLHTLFFSHNGLIFISEEAFSRVLHLRYLDLSSNKLRTLEELHFHELEELEVLLLYNNQISQIDKTAFEGTSKLQKLYLSQNQISRFPLELVVKKTRSPELELLDVSGNKIKSLPIAELNSLPAFLKNSLYLHDNPLLCDCPLYLLLTQWHARQLNSAVDFRDEFQCVLPLNHKLSIRLFNLQSDYMNCSVPNDSELEAFLEDTLTIHCDTKLRNMTKVWMTPSNETIQAGQGNQSAQVLPNGSLQLRELRPEDSGTYTCFAISSHFNETISVQLKVHNSSAIVGYEGLNTAYTTLVGCVASVVLVLIYLYLTPCHCWCRKKAETQQEESIHSSSLSTTPTHQAEAEKEALDMRVAFIDPARCGLGQNGKVQPNAVEQFEDKRLSATSRKKSDSESFSTVLLDSPVVV